MLTFLFFLPFFPLPFRLFWILWIHASTRFVRVFLPSGSRRPQRCNWNNRILAKSRSCNWGGLYYGLFLSSLKQLFCLPPRCAVFLTDVFKKRVFLLIPYIAIVAQAKGQIGAGYPKQPRKLVALSLSDSFFSSLSSHTHIRAHMTVIISQESLKENHHLHNLPSSSETARAKV